MSKQLCIYSQSSPSASIFWQSIWFMRNNTGVKLGVCHMWQCWIHQVFGEGELVGVWCKSIQWKDFTAYIVSCAGINLGEKSLFVLFNDLLYSVSTFISNYVQNTDSARAVSLHSLRTHQDTLSSQEILQSDFIGLGLWLASSDLEENGDQWIPGERIIFLFFSIFFKFYLWH